MRKFVFAVMLGIACLDGGARLAAQDAGVPVRILVTAEPRHGSDLPVINRDEVMVYQGHDRDQVTDWVPARSDQSPLELFVLLDDSSTASLGSQLEDIRHFIMETPANAKIGVAYMQNGIARIQQDLTSDHEAAAKALRLPMAVVGVNDSPYFAVSDLAKRWPQSTARREVLLVSDGIDRYYGVGDMQDPYLDAAVEDCQRAGIVVSAIYAPGVGHLGHSYWWNYWGQLYLSALAEKTGGEAYYIGFNGPAVAFQPYLDELTHRLNHQFLLTFLAKPAKKAGLQSIRLKSEAPNVDLVAPSAVWVPSAQ